MARDAYIFLIPLVLGILLSLWGGFVWPGLLLLILAGFIGFFFRDPRRAIPADPNAIVSPADGRVIRLVQEGDRWILSVFLSIFDVHINRAPIAGKIVKREHRPGRFRLAWDDRASVENERCVITIAEEQELTFSLVAGILARRIRVWKKEGEKVGKGDKIGLIRFGSRVDIILPPSSEVAVKQGDRVYGGQSVIACWKTGHGRETKDVSG